MVRTGRVVLAVVALAVFAAACSSPFGRESLNPDCVPTEVDGAPLTELARRFRDVKERLTGYQPTEENEESGNITDHPNFGGMWGDMQGGIVVAVLDCSKVDANELAYLAGGADYLHLIEVPYTDRQWVDLKTELWQELEALGVDYDMNVVRSQTGRVMQVRVRDAGALPDSFAPGVPDDVYVVVEAQHVGTLPAG